MNELKKEFEKFVEYEICDNPDHGFIEAIPGDVSRLGCPLCGHDEEHRILSTQRFNEKPEAVWNWFESKIKSLLKKERISEDRMWQEWITVRGSEPIPLKDIKQRISDLEGGSE